MKKNDELIFLEEYYAFWLKKNSGSSFESFIAIAEKSLVKTGQIAKQSLESFNKTYDLQQELLKKEEEVRKLMKEIEKLKKEANIAPTFVDDGCGRGGYPRSSC